MSEKKNYILNCNVCDTRKVQENVFEGYEKVVINADILISNQRSKAILNKYAVTLNVDAAIESEEEFEFTTQNGSYEINSESVPVKAACLVVNGSLIIRPGTEEILKKYVKIVVNGGVKCPQSLAAYVQSMSVNGMTEFYPDECILMGKTLEIDKYFPVRARENGYYYSAEVLMLDEKMDLEKLKNKKVRFRTEKLTIAEQMLEDVIHMFNDELELVVVPEGYRYLEGTVALDKKTVKKYGTRLFVDGDLELNETEDQVLDQIESLKVTGEIKILEEQQEKFEELDAEYDSVTVVKGMIISDRIDAVIDCEMMEMHPSGILVQNIVDVKISEDIPAEQILEMLQIENCVSIFCSESQKSAVTMISKNVVYIKTVENEEKSRDKNTVEELLKGNNVINADNYVL